MDTSVSYVITMEPDSSTNKKDNLSFFSLESSSMPSPNARNALSISQSGKKISTLSFDPAKVRKSVIPRDEADLDSFLDENFSREGLLCQLCGETYNTKRSLDLHMKFHAAREIQRSPEKPQPVHFEDDIENDGEKKRIYRPRFKKYECSICQKRFSTKDNIRSHMKVHSGETPFQCPLCVKRFTHGRNLHRHITVSHKEHDPNEARDLCTKLMQQVNSHENRMVVYTGEKPKPYKCGVCSKKFRRLYRVKSHTRSHTGQKPFQCSVCSKLFSSGEILSRHVRRLHNKANVSCKAQKPKIEEIEQTETEQVNEFGGHTTIIQIDDGSGSTFNIPVQQSSANDLTFLHSSRPGEVYAVNGDGSNDNIPTYYIDLRTSEITTAQPINAIVQAHPEQVQPQIELQQQLPDHEDDDIDDQDDQHELDSPEKAFQCSMCGQAFDSGPELNKHVSTHKFDIPCKCYLCGKIFKKESYLKRHMAVHSEEKPFKCTLCPKAFKRQYRLNNHWRSHTGEKPYGCPVCSKSFAVSDNLYKHIKKIHKGAGINSAASLIKQIQESNREKKYALLYGDIEVIEDQVV